MRYQSHVSTCAQVEKSTFFHFFSDCFLVAEYQQLTDEDFFELELSLSEKLHERLAFSLSPVAKAHAVTALATARSTMQVLPAKVTALAFVSIIASHNSVSHWSHNSWILRLRTA